MTTQKRSPLTSSPLSHEVSVILNRGSYLEGKLQFEGTARIDGNFKGDILTSDILVIGQDAIVQGQVEADVVIVFGQFQGEILAYQRVELHPPAIVKGTIQTAVFHLEEGALFEGKSKMISNLENPRLNMT